MIEHNDGGGCPRWRGPVIEHNDGGVGVRAVGIYAIAGVYIVAMTDREEIAERAIDEYEDVRTFVERHGEDMLLEAVRETLRYFEGEQSRRMAAVEMGVGMYEGITVTERIERVIEEVE